MLSNWAGMRIHLPRHYHPSRSRSKIDSKFTDQFGIKVALVVTCLFVAICYQFAGQPSKVDQKTGAPALHKLWCVSLADTLVSVPVNRRTPRVTRLCLWRISREGTEQVNTTEIKYDCPIWLMVFCETKQDFAKQHFANGTFYSHSSNPHTWKNDMYFSL